MATQAPTMILSNKYAAAKHSSAEEKMKDLKDLLTLATPMGIAIGFLVNLSHLM